MTDASDADRWEQELPVGEEPEDDEPAIDLERAEADAIEQAQVLPDDDEEHLP
jgi:hypothetical protein